MAVGADHLDLEARDAALAQLLERARDAVGRADAVGHQRDARRVAVGAGELALLPAEERGRGRVGDRGDARLEDLGGGARPSRRRSPSRGDRQHPADRGLELALVEAAGAPVQLGVAEAVGLHVARAARASAGRGRSPRAMRAAARAQSSGPMSAAERAGAGVALRHHPLDHPQHDRGVGRRALAAAVRAHARSPSRRAPTWRPSPARRGPRRGRRAGGRGTRAACSPRAPRSTCGRCRPRRGRRSRRCRRRRGCRRRPRRAR